MQSEDEAEGSTESVCLQDVSGENPSNTAIITYERTILQKGKGVGATTQEVPTEETLG